MIAKAYHSHNVSRDSGEFDRQTKNAFRRIPVD